MNKRFKRYQKLLAVSLASLASLSCADFHASEQNSGIFADVLAKLKSFIWGESVILDPIKRENDELCKLEKKYSTLREIIPSTVEMCGLSSCVAKNELVGLLDDYYDVVTTYPSKSKKSLDDDFVKLYSPSKQETSWLSDLAQLKRFENILQSSKCNLGLVADLKKALELHSNHKKEASNHKKKDAPVVSLDRNSWTELGVDAEKKVRENPRLDSKIMLQLHNKSEIEKREQRARQKKKSRYESNLQKCEREYYRVMASVTSESENILLSRLLMLVKERKVYYAYGLFDAFLTLARNNMLTHATSRDALIDKANRFLTLAKGKNKALASARNYVKNLDPDQQHILADLLCMNSVANNNKNAIALLSDTLAGIFSDGFLSHSEFKFQTPLNDRLDLFCKSDTNQLVDKAFEYIKNALDTRLSKELQNVKELEARESEREIQEWASLDY